MLRWRHAWFADDMIYQAVINRLQCAHADIPVCTTRMNVGPRSTTKREKALVGSIMLLGIFCGGNTVLSLHDCWQQVIIKHGVVAAKRTSQLACHMTRCLWLSQPTLGTVPLSQAADNLQKRQLSPTRMKDLASTDTDANLYPG